MAGDLGFSLADLLATNQSLPGAYDQGQQYAQQQAAQQTALQNAAQARAGMAAALAGKDYQGAAGYAYLNGNAPVGDGLTTLARDNFANQDKAGANFANIVSSVASLPYTQRAAAIQAAAPTLSAMGFDPAMVSQFDPTDENIKALGHIGYTYGDQVKDDIAQQGADTADQNADTEEYKAHLPQQYAEGTVGISFPNGPNQPGVVVARAPKTIVAAPTDNVYVDGGGAGTGVGGANYDATYGKGQYGTPATPLTSMTLGQVQDYQKNNLIPATRGKIGQGANVGTGAAGGYQITYGTLQKYGPQVFGANWQNVQFTPQNQDLLAQAIYNDAKGGDLHNIWSSLPANAAGAYANVPFSQVQSKILAGESGSPSQSQSGGVTLVHQGAPDTKNETGLTQQALTDQADLIIQKTGGIIPAGYARNKADAEALSNRISSRLPELGLTPQLAVQLAATNKAGIASLQNLRKRTDVMEAAASGAQQNGQLLLQIGSQLNNGQNQWVNSIGNTIANRTGDPVVAAFIAAREAYANQVASVLGNGGASNVAKEQQAREAINNSQSPAQLQSVVNTFNRDIINRKNGNETIYQHTLHSLGGGAPAPSASSIPPAAIAYLHANPATRNHFDAMFGAGSSARFLGN